MTALDDDYPLALRTLDPRPPALFVAGDGTDPRAARRRDRRDTTRLGLRARHRRRAGRRACPDGCRRRLGPRAGHRWSRAPRCACRRRQDDRRPALRAGSRLPSASPWPGARDRPLRRPADDRGADRRRGRPARLRPPQPHHRRALRGGHRGRGAGPLGRPAHCRGGAQHRPRAVRRAGADRRHVLPRLQPADRRPAGRRSSPLRPLSSRRSASLGRRVRRPRAISRRSRVSSSAGSWSAADRSRSWSIGRDIRRPRWPAAWPCWRRADWSIHSGARPITRRWRRSGLRGPYDTNGWHRTMLSRHSCCPRAHNGGPGNPKEPCLLRPIRTREGGTPRRRPVRVARPSAEQPSSRHPRLAGRPLVHLPHRHHPTGPGRTGRPGGDPDPSAVAAPTKPRRGRRDRFGDHDPVRFVDGHRLGQRLDPGPPRTAGRAGLECRAHGAHHPAGAPVAGRRAVSRRHRRAVCPCRWERPAEWAALFLHDRRRLRRSPSSRCTWRPRLRLPRCRPRRA